jgi:hypothetical protein
MPARIQCPKCNRWALICSTQWKKSICFSCDWMYVGNWGQRQYEEALERCRAANEERAAQRESLK